MDTSLKCLTISALLALTLVVIPAQAQVERASIIGNVTDKTGAVLAGVVVTVTHQETNTAIKVTTRDTGAFTAVNLIPGSYTISASLPGFALITYRNFVLQVSQQARLNFVMELGALEQSVEVTAAAPLLQTENASVGPGGWDIPDCHRLGVRFNTARLQYPVLHPERRPGVNCGRLRS